MIKHHISFKHAIDGLIYVFKSQPNFRIHTLATMFVLLLSYLLNIPTSEFIILLFCIMWVLIAEMVNTAIESVVDLVTQEKRQFAKIAKDVSAGMVLLSATMALVIGAVIFSPYLFENIFKI